MNDFLLRKKMLLVGAGCVGASIAEILVRSGVYSLTIIDSDIFEVGNLSRHVLNVDDIGGLKGLSLCNYLNSLNPHANIEVINNALTIDGGNCSVENAYRLLVGRFPLDPDLKITAALALRIDPEEFIFRYDTSKSTTASEAKRAKRFCELVIAMMEHKKLTKSEFIHKSGVHSFTADTMLAGETTSLLYRTLEKTSAALEIPIETIIDHISGLKPAI